MGGGVERIRVQDHSPPPPRTPGGPAVCTHHPLFLSAAARCLRQLHVKNCTIVFWIGAHQIEVYKSAGTDGDAPVLWTRCMHAGEAGKLLVAHQHGNKLHAGPASVCSHRHTHAR